MINLKEATKLRHPEKIVLETLFNNLKELRLFVSGRLLDVGCWKKPYEPLFKELVSRYIGIDYPSQIFQDSLADVWGSASSLPFRNATFDTVLCTQALEHVPEPQQMMDEIYRVLKPNGHLILTAPAMWRLHAEPHDYYRFTEYGLRYIASNSGFDLTLIRPLSGYIGTLGQVLCFGLEFFMNGNGKSFRRLRSKISHILWAGINAISISFDKIFPIEGFPLGYVMVGKK